MGHIGDSSWVISELALFLTWQRSPESLIGLARFLHFRPSDETVPSTVFASAAARWLAHVVAASTRRSRIVNE